MKDSGTEAEGYAHVIRGLISYHERMNLTSIRPGFCEKQETCPAVSHDIYLDALRFSLAAVQEKMERTDMLIKQPQNDGDKPGEVFKENSGGKRQERLEYCKEQLKTTIRTLFFLSGGLLCFKFPFMIFFCILFLTDILLTD